METPDPPNDTPGALKQVVLTPHDIPWSLRGWLRMIMANPELAMASHGSSVSGKVSRSSLGTCFSHAGGTVQWTGGVKQNNKGGVKNAHQVGGFKIFNPKIGEVIQFELYFSNGLTPTTGNARMAYFNLNCWLFQTTCFF